MLYFLPYHSLLVAGIKRREIFMNTVSPWPSRILKGFGFANLFFSLIGFLFLISIVLAFSFFPRHELFGQKMSYFNPFSITMTICNLAFLVGLLVTGLALIKGTPRSVLFCNVLFLLELIYFYSLKVLPRLPAYQRNHDLMFSSVMGSTGIWPQMLPVYPIVAIVVLNFVRFKFKESIQAPQAIEQKRSLGITLFALWFMFCGIAPLFAVIFSYRNDGVDMGQNAQIFFLQNFCSLVLGFFILKRKEWARRGILILTAAGLLLSMAYISVPYFKASLHRDMARTEHHWIIRQQAMLERMEIQDPYYYGEMSKIIKDVDQKTRGLETNFYLTLFPLLLSLLWFLFVYFFFTRPRTKEQFTWDPDIGQSGRFFIRFLVLLCLASLCGLLLLPGKGRLYFSRGISYRNRGEWRKAAEEYSKAMFFEPQSKELYMRRGFVLEKMGYADKALKDYDKALEMDPFYTQVLINRSLIYFSRGRYESALGDAYVAVKHEPGNFDAQLDIGCDYERLKRPLPALAHFKIAEKLKPQDSQVHANLSYTYLTIGDYQNALQEANKAVMLNPRSTLAYNNRAAIWYKLKDFVRYAKDWMMVYQIDPANSEAPYWALYGYYRAGDASKVKEMQAKIPKAGISPLRGIGLASLLAQDHADGEVTGFDPQKMVRYERRFKDGKLEGPARDLNKDGGLLDEFNYSNGLINGPWKVYKRSRLREEWNYKDDMADGVVKQYTPDGRIKCSWTYAEGQANGPYACFYPNGKVQWQGSYKNGFPDGLEQSYYESGVPDTKQQYKLGDIDGQQQYFDENGRIAAEYLYKEGKVIRHKIYRDSWGGLGQSGMCPLSKYNN